MHNEYSIQQHLFMSNATLCSKHVALSVSINSGSLFRLNMLNNEPELMNTLRATCFEHKSRVSHEQMQVE